MTSRSARRIGWAALWVTLAALSAVAYTATGSIFVFVPVFVAATASLVASVTHA